MVLSQYLPEQGGGHSNEDIDIDYCIDTCAIIGLSKSHILEEGTGSGQYSGLSEHQHSAMRIAPFK